MVDLSVTSFYTNFQNVIWIQSGISPSSVRTAILLRAEFPVQPHISQTRWSEHDVDHVYTELLM
jgi:hypothetical protein